MMKTKLTRWLGFTFFVFALAGLSGCFGGGYGRQYGYAPGYAYEAPYAPAYAYAPGYAYAPAPPLRHQRWYAGHERREEHEEHEHWDTAATGIKFVS